ncbi:MAG TPA: hypothetical protein VGL29_21935 [Blastocatellia bacterium]
MWNRTKRLINSYLDDLIERVSGPDREAREVTRAELARLNELEVQTRASAKMFEKELAEIELKMVGVTEREGMARERGDQAGASDAGRQLVALGAERDMLRQQLSEANSAVERARSLREDRRRMGGDLATETQLTAMRETLSSVQRPFDSTDPAATIDEMRERIRRSGVSSTDDRVAEADRELAAERARARVDEMLAQYKQGVGAPEPTSPTRSDVSQAAPSSTPTGAAESTVSDEAPSESKSLGRTEGPVRPID